jgi:hypothetical protein
MNTKNSTGRETLIACPHRQLATSFECNTAVSAFAACSDCLKVNHALRVQDIPLAF